MLMTTGGFWKPLQSAAGSPQDLGRSAPLNLLQYPEASNQLLQLNRPSQLAAPGTMQACCRLKSVSALASI